MYIKCNYRLEFSTTVIIDSNIVPDTQWVERWGSLKISSELAVTRQEIHDSLELSFTQEGQLLEYSTTVITDSNIVPDTQKVVLGDRLKLSSALAATRQESDDILELSLTQEE